MSKSKRTVGLLGPWGSGNLGDAAIQDAMIHNIKRHLPSAQIFGFSGNPGDTERRHHIRSFLIIRPNTSTLTSEPRTQKPGSINARLRTALSAIPFVDAVAHRLGAAVDEIHLLIDSYKALRHVDLLIMSGGGQLDDYWGGPWRHPYVLLKWAMLAKATGTRLAFVSVGADSIRSPLSRFFVKHSLRLANYRSYRDDRTRTLVEKMGVRNNAVYPDLAFSLPVTRREEECDGEHPVHVVGINAIAAGAGTEEDAAVYRNYLEQQAAVVSWLLRTGYQVLFFSSQMKADPPVVRVIRERVEANGKPPADGIIENQALTTDDLIRQISSVDIVVASRLHSVLLAYLMHKPVLAISFSHKVDLLMEDMGMSEYCLDVSGISAEAVIGRFKALEVNRQELVRTIAGKVARHAKALDEQYQRLFTDAG